MPHTLIIIQGGYNIANFEVATRCILASEPIGTADSLSSNPHVTCYYLMGWVFISEWYSQHMIMGRCMPWVMLKREKRAARRQPSDSWTLCRLDWACGQRLTTLSGSALSVPGLARREHVSSHAHIFPTSLSSCLLKLLKECPEGLPSVQIWINCLNTKEGLAVENKIFFFKLFKPKRRK